MFLDVERNLGVIKQSLRKVDRIYTIQQDLKLTMQSSNRNKFKLRSLISFIRHNRLKYKFILNHGGLFTSCFIREHAIWLKLQTDQFHAKKNGFFYVSFFHYYVSTNYQKYQKHQQTYFLVDT